MASLSPGNAKRPVFRSRTSFQARAAEDTAAQLDNRAPQYPSRVDPRYARFSPSPQRNSSLQNQDRFDGPQESVGPFGLPPIRSFFSGSYGRIRLEGDESKSRKRQPSKSLRQPAEYKPPRPKKETPKLGTFAGAFVPVSLNVLSILMFLRFGFILGQSGFLVMMGK